MSAALALAIEQMREFIDPATKCRFCGCSQDEPCVIPVCEEDEGIWRLVRTEAEATELIACSWFLPGVCSSPACTEKLLAECRGTVVLFDAQGKRAPLPPVAAR